MSISHTKRDLDVSLSIDTDDESPAEFPALSGLSRTLQRRRRGGIGGSNDVSPNSKQLPFSVDANSRHIQGRSRVSSVPAQSNTDPLPDSAPRSLSYTPQFKYSNNKSCDDWELTLTATPRPRQQQFASSNLDSSTNEELSNIMSPSFTQFSFLSQSAFTFSPSSLHSDSGTPVQYQYQDSMDDFKNKLGDENFERLKALWFSLDSNESGSVSNEQFFYFFSTASPSAKLSEGVVSLWECLDSDNFGEVSAITFFKVFSNSDDPIISRFLSRLRIQTEVFEDESESASNFDLSNSWQSSLPFASSNQRQHGLHKKIDILQAQMRSCDSDNDELRQRNSEMIHDIRLKDKQIENLKTQITELRMQVNDLKSQNSENTTRYDDLKLKYKSNVCELEKEQEFVNLLKEKIKSGNKELIATGTTKLFNAVYKWTRSVDASKISKYEKKIEEQENIIQDLQETLLETKLCLQELELEHADSERIVSEYNSFRPTFHDDTSASTSPFSESTLDHSHRVPITLAEEIRGSSAPDCDERKIHPRDNEDTSTPENTQRNSIDSVHQRQHFSVVPLKMSEVSTQTESTNTPKYVPYNLLCEVLSLSECLLEFVSIYVQR